MRAKAEEQSGVQVQAQQPGQYGFLTTDKGVMWMNGDGTWAADCWLNLGEAKYHFDENGYLQLGMTNVGDETYYLYYTGMMATGWLTQGADLYFFNPDGTMAKDTVINGYRFGSDGRLEGIDEQAQEEKSELEQVVDNILASIITPDMTEDQKIAACYQYMVDASSYKRTYETPSGDWTGQFAMEILITGKGNCYRYAAGFAYLLKGLGYDTKVITGEIGSRRGGMAPHGWTEVLIDTDWYVFDTEMQDANGKKNYYWKTYATYPSKPLVKRAEWPVYF